MKRAFTIEDQAKFARLSGDRNPMHMDSLAARRTQAGAPVVHGIHVLLWVLDGLADAGVSLEVANNIRVKFSKFIYLQQDLEVAEQASSINSRRFTVLADGMAVASIVIGFGHRRDVDPEKELAVVEPRTTPANPTLQAMHDQSGRLSPMGSLEEIEGAFPHASKKLNSRRLSGFAELSYLVGMVCPGLNSVFAGLDIEIVNIAAVRRSVGFHSEVDHRFNMVKLNVTGDGLVGDIEALVRQEPVEVPSIGCIAARVGPVDFAGVTALIVGGSRGLGAATARILGAGGGRLWMTYAYGRREAETIKQEINAFRRQEVCDVLELNVIGGHYGSLESIGSKINQLYYFATPKIFVQKSRLFSEELLSRFMEVYVTGFHDVLSSLAPKAHLTVLYPSSEAIDRRPRGMTEYAMAKAAGEILCADLAKAHRNIDVRVVRLPRILTDQTATVAAVESADAVSAMLPIIQSLRAAER
jgi:NAD(P)-dependent dehydrogenase (short-subunit alcohol dehydrogenase family)